MKVEVLCLTFKSGKAMLDHSRRRMKVWMHKHLLQVMLWLVILLFGGNFCIMFTGLSDAERGTFGDQFGAVNALFSGLAFAGLIYTIILQRKDLKL